MDFHFSCSTRYLTRSLRLLEELQLIGDWTSRRTIQGVIVLVISNRPSAKRSADFEITRPTTP